ncbi:unnamed protein product, partial [Prorocentrum cordatum]
ALLPALQWEAAAGSEVPLRPPHLLRRLAPAAAACGVAEGRVEAACADLLAELSVAVAGLLRLPSSQRRGRLDGLLDMSSPDPKEHPGRTARRRLHQALGSLVRFVLHDPGAHLAGFAEAAASPGGLRRFADGLLERKGSLRALCQSAVAFSTVPPARRGADASAAGGGPEERAQPAAAFVHGLKQWSRAFHDWCAEAVAHFFLLDPVARRSWTAGPRDARSRVTVLTDELRRRSAAARVRSGARLADPAWAELVREAAGEVLLPIGARPRLLDVGSCGNYFGLVHGERLDVLPLDLAPAHPSVHACDFLELVVDPPGAEQQRILDEHGRPTVRRLAAGGFDVVVMSLLLSVLPGAEARGAAVAKARRLLRERPGRGLLIIADTAGAVGRHADAGARRSGWVSAVEANGFRLARDPQMHLSRLRERGPGGVFSHRAFCWTFTTGPCPPGGAGPRPVPLRGEERRPRPLAPER